MEDFTKKQSGIVINAQDGKLYFSADIFNVEDFLSLYDTLGEYSHTLQSKDEINIILNIIKRRHLGCPDFLLSETTATIVFPKHQCSIPELSIWSLEYSDVIYEFNKVYNLSTLNEILSYICHSPLIKYIPSIASKMQICANCKKIDFRDVSDQQLSLISVDCMRQIAFPFTRLAVRWLLLNINQSKDHNPNLLVCENYQTGKCRDSYEMLCKKLVSLDFRTRINDYNCGSIMALSELCTGQPKRDLEECIAYHFRKKMTLN